MLARLACLATLQCVGKLGHKTETGQEAARTKEGRGGCGQSRGAPVVCRLYTQLADP